MTKGDVIVERSAESLEGLAQRAAARHDGFGELIAEELDASAKFLRKLKPSLIASRIRRKKKAQARSSARRSRSSGGPPPMLVVGGALLAGMLLARAVNASGNGD
jgi:uncharacterized protein with von Willebrand factor type A (vWA) domain